MCWAGLTDPVVREALQPLIGELRKQHASVYEMLKRMDRNKDGILSRDELCDGLSEMCVTLTPAQLDSVMRAFDKDGNGNVSYHEFYAVLTKHRAVDHIEASMCRRGGCAADAPRMRRAHRSLFVDDRSNRSIAVARGQERE